MMKQGEIKFANLKRLKIWLRDCTECGLREGERGSSDYSEKHFPDHLPFGAYKVDGTLRLATIGIDQVSGDEHSSAAQTCVAVDCHLSGTWSELTPQSHQLAHFALWQCKRHHFDYIEEFSRWDAWEIFPVKIVEINYLKEIEL